MLRKFSVQELRPGMFIVDASSLMPDTPNLYTHEGLLKSLKEAEAIAGQGYREALVDLNRSYKEWAVLYSDTAEAELATIAQRRMLSPDASNLLKPKAELGVEFPKAEKIYKQALQTAQHVMQNFKSKGEVDVKAGGLVVEQVIESVLANAGALQAVSKLYSRDDYTFSHCVNVSMLTVMFVRYLGGSDTELFEAGLAGFFHDLGKMQMPTDILSAPRRLTAEEFSVMRRHPQIGWEYMRKLPEFSENVLAATLEHHERVDGSGYPGAKKENEISKLGKIVAIVDVYDALSSRRVYKDSILPHRVLGLLYGMRDRELHTELTEHFIHCMGIYPPGSVVRLTTGEISVVMQTNYSAPLHPAVLLVRDTKGTAIIPALPVDLNLKKESAVSVCLKAGDFGVHPALVLKEHAKLQTKIA